MWQRFTEEARRVMLYSMDEAKRAESSHVDTEHILLGLVILDELRAIHLLERMGFDARALRTDAANAVAEYPRKQDDKDPKLNVLGKRALELSGAEGHRLGHRKIGVEHLLLGLICQTEGIAFKILSAHGADLEKARSVFVQEQEIAEQKASYRVVHLPGVGFDQEIVEVMEVALQWANLSHGSIGTETLLLSLLERRADLLVEILGLDVLALKEARLKLALRLDLYKQAALLRDEIENGHS